MWSKVNKNEEKEVKFVDENVKYVKTNVFYSNYIVLFVEQGYVDANIHK